jgi:hypothetical protein
MTSLFSCLASAQDSNFAWSGSTLYGQHFICLSLDAENIELAAKQVLATWYLLHCYSSVYGVMPFRHGWSYRCVPPSSLPPRPPGVIPGPCLPGVRHTVRPRQHLPHHGQRLGGTAHVSRQGPFMAPAAHMSSVVAVWSGSSICTPSLLLL